MTYALDTNIVIRYLRKDISVRNYFREVQEQGHDIVLPIIVDYEIRRGLRIISAPRKKAAYVVLTEGLSIAELDNTTWEKAEEIYAELYQKGFTVGEMDILIAAVCLVNDYTLVTSNTKDFENIEGLEITDWTI